MSSEKKYIFDSEKDSEKLAYEIIAFCKKWGLWQDVCIYTGGKCYTDKSPADEKVQSINTKTDVYVGIDDDPEERCYSDPEHFLDMTFEGPLCLLIRHHEYEVSVDDLPSETLSNLITCDENILSDAEIQSSSLAEDYIENKEGWDPAEFDTYEEYLSLQDEIEYDKVIFNCGGKEFTSAEEYRDYISKAISSKEATLTEYFMDKAKKDVTEYMRNQGGLYYNDGFVADKVLQEFDALFEKYGLWYEPGFSWSLTAHRQAGYLIRSHSAENQLYEQHVAYSSAGY